MTETTTPKPKSKPDPELVAVRRVTKILEALPPASRARVLRFAAERVADEPVPPVNVPIAGSVHYGAAHIPGQIRLG